MLGLNPYCNGSVSKRNSAVVYKIDIHCLNPYCNGSVSKSRQIVKHGKGKVVLILIVMEVFLKGLAYVLYYSL